MTTTSTERDIHFIDCVRHTLFNVGNMFIDIVNHVTIHRIEFICAVEISLDTDMAIIRQFSSRSNLHFVPFYSISFVIRSHHHQWYRCFREWTRLLVLIIVKSGNLCDKNHFYLSMNVSSLYPFLFTPLCHPFEREFDRKEWGCKYKYISDMHRFTWLRL